MYKSFVYCEHVTYM